MKKRLQYIPYTLLILAGMLLMYSCQKQPIHYFNPSRMFTPTSVSLQNMDTAVDIQWAASLYSNAKHVTYTVEVSRDSAFQGTPDLREVADTNSLTVGDDTLRDRTRYFARIKANPSGGSDSSNWLYTSAFTLVGVQIFSPILPTNVLDNAVLLQWTPTSGVNMIVLTNPAGDTTQISLSTADNTAGQKIIDNLTPSTTYSAEIFAGRKSKGIVSFTTKASLSGNIVDLRGITNRPSVLTDTLPFIPSGSIVLLKRGLTYTVTSSYAFDRSVTIMSGMGFSTPAVLDLQSNFDLNGTLDSLRFSDLTIQADGTNYFMNVSHSGATVGKLSVVNCTTRGNYSNSFIRLKSTNDYIGTLYINNCIMDSIGVDSKYAVFYANASSSARIDNIDIHNSTFYHFYYFIREDKVTTTSININQCTFDQMINQGGYFVNETTFPSTFNISNCIFGSTLDPLNSNWISSSANASVFGSYSTSDCTFSANPIYGTASYSGASTDLFTNPTQGDFTIKDLNFSGKRSSGDPRWWQ